MLLFLLFCVTEATLDAIPDYSVWEYVYSDGDILDVGYYGSPCVADWNGDGIQDLIMGRYLNGRVDFYENTGTNSAPVLGPRIKIKADGEFIGVPYG